MSDVQATFFATLVDEWVRGGVTDAVVCPGNRSTLLSAVIANDGRLRTHSMVDERSASFFALGLAKATGRPALLWCTSGTATAELHAAVIEAHQGQVPLLVCTADRPVELQHARDWQTIDQSRLYEGTTRWHFDPGVADDVMSKSWRSIAARSVAETLYHPIGRGPVHINLPVREPWKFEIGELPPGRSNSRPWHSTVPGLVQPSPEVVGELASRAGTEGVIVVGKVEVEAAAVHACAQALGWPVIPEIRSGCRTSEVTTVGAADDILRSAQFAEAHRPTTVLRLGAPILSKSVAVWLAAAGAEEWLVDQYDTWVGPAPDATHIVRADPTTLCLAISEMLAYETSGKQQDSTWLQRWQGAELRAQGALDDALSTGLSEPFLARSLVAGLPDNSILFAATSMPVRDVEWYGRPRDGLRVLANRGASGMDGIVSTAAGASIASGLPTVLLVGDLTFLYDLNALWNLPGASGSIDLTIVVVDNNGGGIFSMLPQLSSLERDVFERFVATPQTVDIAAVTKSFGIPFANVKTAEEFVPSVLSALEKGGLQMVYVKSDRSTNADVHEQVHAAAVAAIES